MAVVVGVRRGVVAVAEAVDRGVQHLDRVMSPSPHLGRMGSVARLFVDLLAQSLADIERRIVVDELEAEVVLVGWQDVDRRHIHRQPAVAGPIHVGGVSGFLELDRADAGRDACAYAHAGAFRLPRLLVVDDGVGVDVDADVEAAGLVHVGVRGCGAGLAHAEKRDKQCGQDDAAKHARLLRGKTVNR